MINDLDNLINSSSDIKMNKDIFWKTIEEANFEEFGYVAYCAYENITDIDNEEIFYNYDKVVEKNADTTIAEINREIELRPDLDVDINNADAKEVFPILYKKHHYLYIGKFNRLYDEGKLD